VPRAGCKLEEAVVKSECRGRLIDKQIVEENFLLTQENASLEEFFLKMKSKRKMMENRHNVEMKARDMKYLGLLVVFIGCIFFLYVRGFV
jgi:hypothetical protein